MFYQVVLPIHFSTKKKDSLIKSEILLLSDLCFYHVFLQKGYSFTRIHKQEAGQHGFRSADSHHKIYHNGCL